jgi:hypothetical protein
MVSLSEWVQSYLEASPSSARFNLTRGTWYVFAFALELPRFYLARQNRQPTPLPLSVLLDTGYRLEYIAYRDIALDEEIFIDYGE